MTDKNLFLYDLAVTAIFKDEGKYLKEWLDYHLLAGVEHFYLYNNDSSDDYAEILAPYVKANLVTLINLPGKSMQMVAYNDAIEKFRFDCRYMAFIDLDEFIFPKTNRSIVKIVDEILSQDAKSAGLAINWQIFGSNGQDKADYSRGVLERFTRRAPSDWVISYKSGAKDGNIYIKSIVNPRRVDYFMSPHYAFYFDGWKSINTAGAETYRSGNYPICADKIVINHYFTESKEEYTTKKMSRGYACFDKNPYSAKNFELHDRNEVFDDSILRYRAARAESFSLENDEEKIHRMEKALIETLTQRSLLDAPDEFFVGKLETFLTCRAVAEKLGLKIGSKTAEEYALAWIYQTFVKAEAITHAEIQQFIRALPEILNRPFPLCKKLKTLTQESVIPSFCEALKDVVEYGARNELLQLQKFLRLIK